MWRSATGSPSPPMAGGTSQCPTSDATGNMIQPAAASACRPRTAQTADSSAVASATPASSGATTVVARQEARSGTPSKPARSSNGSSR